MQRRTVRTFGSAMLALAVSLPLAARSAEAQDDATRLLRDVAGASRDDLARMADGVPFIRTVPGGSDHELTQVHAVRIAAPVRFILDQARERHLLLDDVEGPEARGVFNRPPREEDLQRLVLERAEIRQLKKCRTGDCGLKLPAATIERMHEEVNWSAEDPEDEANRFFRRVLFETLEAYTSRGHAGAPVYGDKPEPLSVRDGFDSLFVDRGLIPRLDPGFRRHLSGYPAEIDPAVEDRFSWTIEDLGVKSVVSLNHVAIKPRTPGGSALVGVKRLYANHYFQAGLRLLVLTPATGDPNDPDTYVTVVTRLRFDGEIGGLKRTAMERRLEMNADEVLTVVRAQLEALFAQQ